MQPVCRSALNENILSKKKEPLWVYNVMYFSLPKIFRFTIRIQIFNVPSFHKILVFFYLSLLQLVENILAMHSTLFVGYDLSQQSPELVQPICIYHFLSFSYCCYIVPDTSSAQHIWIVGIYLNFFSSWGHCLIISHILILIQKTCRRRCRNAFLLGYIEY